MTTAALLLAAAFAAPQADAGALHGPTAFDAIARDFDVDAELLRRFHPIEGAASRNRERAHLEQVRRAVDAVKASLADDRVVDQALLLARIDERLTRLAWREQDAIAAAPLLAGWFDPIAALEETHRAGKPFDAERIGADLAAAAKALDALRAEPKEGEPPSAWRSQPDALRHARDRARESRRWLADWIRRVAPSDPLVAFWCAQPAKALDAALDASGDWIAKQLEELKKTASGNPFAIGRDRYAAELAFERIALTPEEMLAFGEQQLAALQAEMTAETAKWLKAPGFALPADLPSALAELAARGPDWRVGLELSKRDTVPVGEQRLFVQSVAEEAVAFVRAKRLFPLPELATECWRLEMSDLETQKTLAFGYYGGEFMGVGAPLPEMEHQRKLEALRSNARPTTRTVVPHELIPGHHLQGFYADRAPTRAAWHSPFLVEGWAVHGEWLMDQHGFFRDPRERIGHLFWRLLRAARIVVSTRFHLREWTPAQMVDFMVEHAGLERSAAQAEVDRYMTYSPLYQCAYLFGARQVGELREECRAKWVERFSDELFHRRLAEQGSIPLAFARMALLGEREVRAWK